MCFIKLIICSRDVIFCNLSLNFVELKIKSNKISIYFFQSFHNFIVNARPKMNQISKIKFD